MLSRRPCMHRGLLTIFRRFLWLVFRPSNVSSFEKMERAAGLLALERPGAMTTSRSAPTTTKSALHLPAIHPRPAACCDPFRAPVLLVRCRFGPPPDPSPRAPCPPQGQRWRAQKDTAYRRYHHHRHRHHAGRASVRRAAAPHDHHSSISGLEAAKNTQASAAGRLPATLLLFPVVAVAGAAAAAAATASRAPCIHCTRWQRNGRTAGGRRRRKR